MKHFNVATLFDRERLRRQAIVRARAQAPVSLPGYERPLDWFERALRDGCTDSQTDGEVEL